MDRHAPLPSGTVTFVFTDIEGSTRLLLHLGDGYPAVLEEHQRLLRGAFQQSGGHEVLTEGDGFFFAFAHAADAVAAAVAAQRALAAHSWPAGVRVRVRMGLHTGAPALTDAGYVGLDVHRAARIKDAGHGGRVLLSQATRDLVQGELPKGVSVLDLFWCGCWVLTERSSRPRMRSRRCCKRRRGAGRPLRSERSGRPDELSGKPDGRNARRNGQRRKGRRADPRNSRRSKKHGVRRRKRRRGRPPSSEQRHWPQSWSGRAVPSRNARAGRGNGPAF